jgi:ATP synthase protein I
MRALGALSSVGIAFALAVLMGFAIGYWLDRATGLSPLFTILFFFMGVAAGIVNVIRTASSYGNEERRTRERKPGQRQ